MDTQTFSETSFCEWTRGDGATVQDGAESPPTEGDARGEPELLRQLASAAAHARARRCRRRPAVRGSCPRPFPAPEAAAEDDAVARDLALDYAVGTGSSRMLLSWLTAA
jgi:hypothetical protein